MDPPFGWLPVWPSGALPARPWAWAWAWAKIVALFAEIPAIAMPFRNFLRCINEILVYLRRHQIVVVAIVTVFVAHGKAGRPRLIHTHQRQSASQQCKVLGEVDHFIHTLVRVLDAPKVMHHRR